MEEGGTILIGNTGPQGSLKTIWVAYYREGCQA
jgi:hypothetical protein